MKKRRALAADVNDALDLLARALLVIAGTDESEKSRRTARSEMDRLVLEIARIRQRLQDREGV